MKMKITHRAVRAAAALLLAALAYGCTPDSEPTYHYDYYISEYCYITQFDGSQDESPYNKYITLYETCDTYPEWTQKYSHYQTIYNDLTYDRMSEYMTNRVFCNDFLKIDVVSDADFDAKHPAGTSLGDVVRIVAASPYLYIQSGYDSAYEYNWNWQTNSELPEDYIDFRPTVESGYNPVNKLLCDLTADDMKLLWEICFVFAEQPSLSREHNLTFIFTDAEQGDMSFSCRFVFE